MEHMDEERPLLIDKAEVPPAPRRSRARTLMMAAGMGAAFFVGAVMVKQPAFMASNEASLDSKVEYMPFESGAKEDGWYIYKVWSL